MLVRIANFFLILALVVAIGGHWAVLQTVAWTNMLAANLRSESIEAAFTKTFDGKHPCKLCDSITAGKQAEKKTEFPSLVKKLEFVTRTPVFVFAAPQDFQLLTISLSELDGLTHRPSVPPPRTFAV